LNSPWLIGLTGATSLENMERLVGRVIKSSGKFLILSNLTKQEQTYLESSMIKSKINIAGSGLISIGCNYAALSGML
jgi:hypothetical protein